jgi:hypothetical protein
MPPVERTSTVTSTRHDDGPEAYATPMIDFLALASLTVLLAWAALAVLH